ncbi:hypothetical protein CBM2586_B130485 [Cupriavidus phytorum]|uniref:Uncharacterized protein n=1 Tax=Cupriavidus taiwanensis TaxID=164546 RepID=A0A375CIP6_9BURK|nr:hypothetical protein CBM2586_B130485 [Cupriavidus taiwanensis]
MDCGEYATDADVPSVRTEGLGRVRS